MFQFIHRRLLILAIASFFFIIQINYGVFGAHTQSQSIKMAKPLQQLKNVNKTRDSQAGKIYRKTGGRERKRGRDEEIKVESVGWNSWEIALGATDNEIEARRQPDEESVFGIYHAYPSYSKLSVLFRAVTSLHFICSFKLNMLCFNFNLNRK